MPTRARSHGRPLSPVLLLGAGPGEATCGILYLASYLRRNGIEAYVRLFDADCSPREVEQSLSALLSHVRPRLVGISLKWFHHVARARRVANTVRKLAPEVRIVLGGNTASYFWKELSAWDCVDEVVLGDGEVPLLALCRGSESPPNVVSGSGRPPLGYVQGAQSSEVYYSNFDELFLSQMDLHAFTGWVAPGKGCGENCVYCGGGRGVQKTSFGRARPFLRHEQSVLLDHREIAPRTHQLRYDFAGSSAEFLGRAWGGVDLSRHLATFFLWGAPAKGLVEELSRTFQRVHMVLDIGCFSELQRQELMRRGQLKPCPSDKELLGIIDESRRANLQLEISGIAGLPGASEASLTEERRLVDHVLELGCRVGYQRLEAQPGAPVTEHPERYGMLTEARTFEEFLAYFEEHEIAAEGTVPMVRFADRALEAAVENTCVEISERVGRAAASRLPTADANARLRSASVATRNFNLADWLGAYRVAPSMAKELVTVVRSVNGGVLACAPGVKSKKQLDPTLEQGEAGRVLLAALEAFERPTSVKAGLAQLKQRASLDPDSALEVIEHLVGTEFLESA